MVKVEDYHEYRSAILWFQIVGTRANALLRDQLILMRLSLRALLGGEGKAARAGMEMADHV